ncbi:methionine aminopeptidase 1D-like protein, partial [Leptotrombidium deliense]
IGCRAVHKSPNGYNFECVLPQNNTVTKNERLFPSTILKPNYANNVLNSSPVNETQQIHVYSDSEVKAIRKASQLAANILNRIESIISVDTTGEEIDDYVYKRCLEYNCYPSPFNYSGFPKCVTVSVNNVCVHGIPDSRKLKEGDIVTVDVTVFYNGYHGDTAKTFTVGKVDKDATHLINTAKICLTEAIAVCRQGTRFSEIGETIERIAKQNGLNVIPSICGHGIGKNFHESPQIVHFDCRGDLTCDDMQHEMQENMVFTIEPVITDGQVDVEVLSDGWTVVTQDGSRTAQFEHTVCVKREKSVILSI